MTTIDTPIENDFEPSYYDLAIRRAGKRGFIDAKKLGVRPGRDVTSEFRAALALAIHTRQTLALPSGTLDYSGPITADLKGGGLTIRGEGEETYLRNIMPDGGKAVINFSNGRLTLQGLRHGTENASSVSEDEADAGMIFTSISDYQVTHVWNTNIKQSALLFRDCQRGHVGQIKQTGCWRDGLHFTGASRIATVSNFVSVDGGDDVIAVVGYVGQAQPEHIVVMNFVIDGTKSGRGISCVGGRHVKWQNGTITNPFMAGIYIAAEDSYNTYASEYVTASNIDIIGGGRCTSEQTNAAVHISGRRGYVTRHVTLDKVRAIDSAWRALLCAGAEPDNIDTINLSGFEAIDTTDRLNKNGAGAGAGAHVGIDVQFTRNFEMDRHCLLRRTGAGAITVNANCTGRIAIAGKCEDININGPTSADVVNVGKGSLADEITIDVSHSNQTAAVERLIECINPQTTVVRAMSTGGTATRAVVTT